MFQSQQHIYYSYGLTVFHIKCENALEISGKNSTELPPKNALSKPEIKVASFQCSRNASQMFWRIGFRAP